MSGNFSKIQNKTTAQPTLPTGFEHQEQNVESQLVVFICHCFGAKNILNRKTGELIEELGMIRKGSTPHAVQQSHIQHEIISNDFPTKFKKQPSKRCY